MEDSLGGLSSDSHDLRKNEERAKEFHDEVIRLFGKLDRLDQDSDHAKELQEEIEELQEMDQRFYAENEDDRRDMDEMRLAIEEEKGDLFGEQEVALRLLHDEFRGAMDDIETRQLELRDSRWALLEESQEQRNLARSQLKDDANALKDEITSVVDNEIGPLREEAPTLEGHLRKLLSQEQDIQSEIRELTGEVAPMQLEMEGSLLNILGKALSAAADGEIISADDGGQ